MSDAVVDHQQEEQQPATTEKPGLDEQQERAAMQAPQDAAAAPATPMAPANDLTTQLKQLADLQTAGVLSDAEFKAAKAKLLGG